MATRVLAVAAVVAAVVAVILWWLAVDVVTEPAPAVEPRVEGTVRRSTSTTGLLLAGTLSAGVAMVFTTLALLRGAARKES